MIPVFTFPMRNSIGGTVYKLKGEGYYLSLQFSGGGGFCNSIQEAIEMHAAKLKAEPYLRHFNER